MYIPKILTVATAASQTIRNIGAPAKSALVAIQARGISSNEAKASPSLPGVGPDWSSGGASHPINAVDVARSINSTSLSFASDTEELTNTTVASSAVEEPITTLATVTVPTSTSLPPPTNSDAEFSHLLDPEHAANLTVDGHGVKGTAIGSTIQMKSVVSDLMDSVKNFLCKTFSACKQ